MDTSRKADESPQSNNRKARPAKRERRAEPRTQGNALVTVLRDDDLMRNGIAGRLYDISAVGISLLLPVPLRLGEYVVVLLENPVQRVTVKLRVLVRHVQPPHEGWYRIGCAPLRRLNLRDLQAFRANRWTQEQPARPTMSPNLERMRGH